MASRRLRDSARVHNSLRSLYISKMEFGLCSITSILMKSSFPVAISDVSFDKFLRFAEIDVNTRTSSGGPDLEQLLSARGTGQEKGLFSATLESLLFERIV